MKLYSYAQPPYIVFLAGIADGALLYDYTMFLHLDSLIIVIILTVSLVLSWLCELWLVKTQKEGAE
jgi:hypothetical protein